MNAKPGDGKAEGDRANDVSESLVDRALAGDEGAFNRIVELHQTYVYWVCLGVTGNSYDAEDAMQETFLKAFRGLHQFRREARFRSWLTRIAINEALQRLRKQKDSVASLDEASETDEDWMAREVSDWGPNPEQSLLADELRQVLEDTVLALPARYRVVFVLRDICGHSAAEVAAVMNLKVPAVKSRLLRARLAVRERLALRFKRKGALRERLSQAKTVLLRLFDRFCRTVGITQSGRSRA